MLYLPTASVHKITPTMHFIVHLRKHWNYLKLAQNSFWKCILQGGSRKTKWKIMCMFLKHIKIKIASSAGFENPNSGSKYVYVLFKLIKFSVNFGMRKHQEIRMEQSGSFVLFTFLKYIDVRTTHARIKIIVYFSLKNIFLYIVCQDLYTFPLV